MSIDEQFIYNFKKNGGKFILWKFREIKEQFENILQENDWYESTVLYEPKLFNILKENKLSYEKSNPKFLFSNCENLIAEGSILFCSKQIKQDKPNELPINIVVFATTSQIRYKKATGYAIKRNTKEISRRILPL
jgi:hypothetical protein